MSGGAKQQGPKQQRRKKAAKGEHANPLMPNLRPRHDGWTQDRTRVFLATLGQTGCVEDACRVAGISNTSARRARNRFVKFAAEWDKALLRAHRGLQAIAWQRAVEGKETIIIRKGEEVERRITPDSSILGLLIKNGRLGGAVADIADPDKLLTLTEWRAGWRFNSKGEKILPREDKRILDDAMREKLNLMRRRLQEYHGGKWP